jgi:hypothetical protein
MRRSPALASKVWKALSLDVVAEWAGFEVEVVLGTWERQRRVHRRHSCFVQKDCLPGDQRPTSARTMS